MRDLGYQPMGVKATELSTAWILVTLDEPLDGMSLAQLRLRTSRTWPDAIASKRLVIGAWLAA